MLCRRLAKDVDYVGLHRRADANGPMCKIWARGYRSFTDPERVPYWMNSTNGELLPSVLSIAKKLSYQSRHRWYASTTSSPAAG